MEPDSAAALISYMMIPRAPRSLSVRRSIMRTGASKPLSIIRDPQAFAFLPSGFRPTVLVKYRATAQIL